MCVGFVCVVQALPLYVFIFVYNPMFLLLLFLALASKSSLAIHFVANRNIEHSVWIHPFNDNQWTLVDSNTTINTWSDTNVTIVDFCNFNAGCDGQLERQSTCVAVTPQCNCLRWIGNLNATVSSSNSMQLSAYTTQCVRIRCVGICNIRIDWMLVNVNMTIPKGLEALAYDQWLEIRTWLDVTFEVFAWMNYYLPTCNIAGFSAGCPATSYFVVSPIVSATISDSSSRSTALLLTAIVSIMAFIVGIIVLRRFYYKAY